MNIVQVNLAFSSAVDLTLGMAVPCAISYVGGRLYEKIYQIDQNVAARAFAISTCVLYAFQAFAHFASGGEKDFAKEYYTIQLLGIGLLGSFQIHTYRKLNLIALRGTMFLAACLLAGSWECYIKINEKG